MLKIPSGELRINGEKLASSKTVPLTDPATDDLLQNIHVASENDVISALSSAREAFKSWKFISIRQRLKYLKKFRKLLTGRIEEISLLASAETGHTINYSLSEALNSILALKYYEKYGPDFLAPEKLPVTYHFRLVFNIRKEYRIFDPAGVVGVIPTSDLPIFSFAASVIPAIISGNTVILKPDPHSTLVNIKLFEIFEEAGLPAGAINVINGPGETARLLIKSKINRLLLIGESKAGKELLNVCAESLTPAIAELAGDNTLIVLKDADILGAVNAALLGMTYNCRHFNLSPKRILLAKEIKKQFLEKLLACVKKLNIGDPQDPDTDIGPLISRKTRISLAEFINSAAAKGAKILCGGKAIEKKGAYFEPTVLSDLDLETFVNHKELLGPVLYINDFLKEEETVAMANSFECAAGISIWGRDLKGAQKIAQHISAGTVKINQAGFLHPSIPLGGIKRGGFGKLLAKDGLRMLVDEKAVETLEYRHRFRFYWMPFNKNNYELVRDMIDFMFQDGLKNKLGQIFSIFRNFISQFIAYRKFIKE